MYWWYYYPPMPFYDPMAMMAYTMQWMIVPYYYALYMEMFKATLDAWKKAVEALTSTLAQASKE